MKLNFISILLFSIVAQVSTAQISSSELFEEAIDQFELQTEIEISYEPIDCDIYGLIFKNLKDSINYRIQSTTFNKPIEPGEEILEEFDYQDKVTISFFISSETDLLGAFTLDFSDYNFEQPLRPNTQEAKCEGETFKIPEDEIKQGHYELISFTDRDGNVFDPRNNIDPGEYRNWKFRHLFLEGCEYTNNQIVEFESIEIPDGVNVVIPIEPSSCGREDGVLRLNTEYRNEFTIELQDLNIEASNEIENLEAGTYAYKLINVDDQSCESELREETIEEGRVNGIRLSDLKREDADCNNGGLGSIDISELEEEFEFSLFLDDIEINRSDYATLSPGGYSISRTLLNGNCESDLFSFTISDERTFKLEDLNFDTILTSQTCESQGIFEITIENSSRYNWTIDGTDEGETVVALDAGTYVFEVTEIRSGCSDSFSFDIPDNSVQYKSGLDIIPHATVTLLYAGDITNGSSPMWGSLTDCTSTIFAEEPNEEKNILLANCDGMLSAHPEVYFYEVLVDGCKTRYIEESQENMLNQCGFELVSFTSEQNPISEFTITPNPSSGLFPISVSSEVPIKNILLYGQTGQLMNRWSYSGQNLHEIITVENLPANIYFLIVEDIEKTVMNQKIIITE